MENASKALIIAGAILLSILIIAIGMYIFTSARSTITGSISSMSTQEKNAFNDQFVSYENDQTGSKVKNLIGILVGNANTYEDEVTKIPTLTVADTISVKLSNQPGSANRPANASSTTDYVSQLSAIRNAIEEKHTYWVTMNYGTGGLIDEIVINYTRP